MTEKIYEKRQRTLKSVLADQDLDGILITNLTNIRYISCLLYTSPSPRD